MPAASVIVSTYNRPHHLVRCLEGFRYQTVQDFEILVADDGSGRETAAVITQAARSLAVPLRHVWQEDRGFRKCRVLNEALRAAASDYLIYTDSDCVPERRFVEMHLRYRKPGCVLVGRSVKWGERRSRAIDAGAIARGDHARIRLRDVWDNLHGRNRYLWLGLYLPGDWGFRLAQRIKSNRNTRGGNMSTWKADLCRVNGWNEDFESWGLEDVEIGLRLRRAGLEGVAVTNKALNFHLWHPEGDKRSRSARRAYNATKGHGQAWCPHGLVRAEAPPSGSPPEPAGRSREACAAPRPGSAAQPAGGGVGGSTQPPEPPREPEPRPAPLQRGDASSSSRAHCSASRRSCSQT